MATVGVKTDQLHTHCALYGLQKLNSFTAMKMEEDMSKVIAEFGAICDCFDLNVECLHYTPPLQEKVIATV